MVDTVQADKVKAWDFFNKPNSWYIHIGAFFVIGFVFGFLFKYFGRYVLMLILIAGLSLWALELANVVSINYVALKNLIGLSPDITANGIFSDVRVWVQAHIIETIAAIIGFLVSWIFM